MYIIFLIREILLIVKQYYNNKYLFLGEVTTIVGNELLTNVARSDGQGLSAGLFTPYPSPLSPSHSHFSLPLSLYPSLPLSPSTSLLKIGTILGKETIWTSLRECGTFSFLGFIFICLFF
jgi:hypothetical protein